MGIGNINAVKIENESTNLVENNVIKLQEDGTINQLEHCKPKIVNSNIIDKIKDNLKSIAGQSKIFYHYNAETNKIELIKTNKR